ncbi:hypothetical protein T10_9190 [Trichinella papuae]|uniref:Secreted protein n=1 Tax=Trichinella papuae TaxID=268474 RepID=A0A0V1ME34_9BILA|nr:hypothetical protein T10_9190 [Trichinella papuae]
MTRDPILILLIPIFSTPSLLTARSCSVCSSDVDETDTVRERSSSLSPPLLTDPPLRQGSTGGFTAAGEKG